MRVDNHSSGHRRGGGGGRPTSYTSSPQGRPRRPSTTTPAGGGGGGGGGGGSPSYRRSFHHRALEIAGPESPKESVCPLGPPSSSSSSSASSAFEHERVGAGTGVGAKGERASVAGRPSNLLRYKTELCRTFEENGLCRFGNTCTFAHGIGELRAIPRHPRYKTEPCRQYHTHGYCQYGARCHFVHDPEEAAGVSPMRGFIIRGRHDRLASAMLALAEDAGIVSNPDTSDVLLANLRRLYALRAMKDQPEISDIPTAQEPSEGSEDMSFQSDGLDLSTYLPDNLSARLFETSSNCSMYTSTMSVLGSTSINGNKYDASHEPLMEHSLDASVDNSIDQSIDTGIWSSAWSTTSSLSTSPPGESWWGMWGGSMATPPLSPESRLVPDAPLNLGQPAVTSLPQGIEMDLPNIGMATKFSVKVVTEVIKESVIANPMEVSRGLHLPSIAELCRN